MKKYWLIIILVIFSVTNCFATDVWIKLPKGGKKINFGLAPFTPEKSNAVEAGLGMDVYEILKYDLLYSRYFNIIKPEISAQNQNIDVLLAGTIKIINSTQFAVETKMYDVVSSSEIFNKTYTGNINNYRYASHKINDDIIFFFTGQKGIAHTKIVFIGNNTGSKEIYSIDYDGVNIRQLTRDGAITLFPRWSPDGEKILYTTYKYNNPDLYMMNPDGTDRKPVSTHQGLNICPGWATDTNTIFLTLSLAQSPNIYQIGLSGKILKQITRGKTVNVSPAVSPGNTKLVYISDKAGYPQMYISNIDGTGAKRIYTEGYTDSPVWLPSGDKIIFSMRLSKENNFNIYLYDISQEMSYQLTRDSGNNENPSVSPDGRYIVFSSNRNNKLKNELFIMFIDGSGQRKLADTGGSCFTPHWSP